MFSRLFHLFRLIPLTPLISLVLLLSLTLLPQKAHALDPSRALTQYLHRIWQVQQGLPQATIYTILQTSDGYLWLGTQKGLYRFDGVRFSALDDPALAILQTAWIHDLLESPDHALYVATNEDGLFKITPQKISHYGRGEGLPTNRINRLTRDSQGQIWACTADGLALIPKDASQPPQIIQMQQGLAGNDILAACHDADTHLWVATPNAKLNRQTEGNLFAPYHLKSLPDSASIHDLLCTKKGGDTTLWIATSAGLLSLHNDTEKLYTTADGLPSNEIYRLLQSADSTLWAGTKEGFSRLKDNHFDSYTANDGLSQSTAYALGEDREGSLWVGTKHGLNQFLDGRTIPYTTNEGLPTNETGPILQDARGTIWIGTFGFGLTRFENGSFSTLTTNDGLASNTIHALAQEPDGSLWIGTDHGINHLSQNHINKTYTSTDGLPSDQIKCLLLDKSHNLWAGTSAGIALLQNGKWLSPRNSPDTPIAALIETPDAIWAARENGGLIAIADNTARDLSLEGDPLRDVAAFYHDPDGSLWMGLRGGAGGGLALYDGHKIQTFSIQEGLFDDDIRGIAADDQDRLWFACSKGIFSVPRPELTKLATRTIKSVTSTPFTPTENLRTIECRAGVQPALFHMNDGRIWFSTMRGIIAIDPAHLIRTLPPIPLVIEQILVDGKVLPQTDTNHIGPGVKNVEFRYTALSFVSPTRTTFRYQLEPFDKNWIDAGLRREAFYTNLPPGHYRFRVQNLTAENTWSELLSPAAITLQPYFYQHAWFIPVLLALAALLLLALYRLRLRDERQRIATIFAERGRIARELHDTLIQGFSGVTMEMQAFFTRLRDEENKKGLSEIIRDAGACLREARRSIAGLRQLDESTTNFPAMITTAARELTHQKPIRLLLRLPARLPPMAAEVEYNLIRIIREAIANTLRHAHARTLELSLESAPDKIELHIRDDGQGFNPDTVAAEPNHYGLIGMHERAAEIGAALHVDTTPNRGTTIHVSIPVEAKPK